MQFETFSDFIAMGKYGFYVWLAYGVSAFLLILLVVLSKQKHRAIKQSILAKQKRENRLREAARLQKEAQQQSIESDIKKNDQNKVSP